MVDVPAENLFQPSLRGHADGEHAFAAVDPGEQKAFEVTLGGHHLVGVGDDSSLGTAPCYPDVIHGADAQPAEPAEACADQFSHLIVHQFVDHGPPQVTAAKRPEPVPYSTGCRGYQRQLQEFVE